MCMTCGNVSIVDDLRRPVMILLCAVCAQQGSPQASLVTVRVTTHWTCAVFPSRSERDQYVQQSHVITDETCPRTSVAMDFASGASCC